MDDKILGFFKERSDVYVSGEGIGEAFGISRTAVWKHIEKLRDEGYDIVALPHLGYRLLDVPDRLSAVELKWQLGTKVIGKRIYSYEKIDSTNDSAYNLAVSGEPEGSVVISERQTKGRGRLGRKWVSPKAKGAYFSVILRPDIPPNEVSAVTLFLALSVAKTIREFLNLSALIKWPNDVLIDGEKTCGILTEMSAEADKIHFVIAGIGININTKKELLPEGACSLSEKKGTDIPRLDFVKALFKSIDMYYNIFNKGDVNRIINEYKKLCVVLDKQVKVTFDNAVISGKATDIDEKGALILRLDTGFQKRILAGDVAMLRPKKYDSYY